MFRTTKILIFITSILVALSAQAESLRISKYQRAQDAAREKTCINIELEEGQSCTSCNDAVCIIAQYVGELSQSNFHEYEFALFDHGGDMIQPFEYSELSFSNEPSGKLLLAEKDLRYGFIDIHGNTVIDFQYWSAQDFSDGLACVQENSSYSTEPSCAYINTKGETIIPAGLWDDSGSFSEGLAAVMNKQGKHGYINTKGEVVIPFEYDGEDFIAGRARIETDAGFGYIDKQGKAVIAPQYLEARYFNENGIAAVKGSDGWGFIDVNGVKLTELIYQYVENQFVDGLAEVQLGNCRYRSRDDDATQVCRRGLMASSGYLVLPTEFKTISLAESSGRKVIIAEKEGEAEDEVYHCLYDYQGGVLADCLYAEMDLDGDYIFAVQTRTLNTTVQTKKDTSEHSESDQSNQEIWLAGVMDLSGRTVIPFEYDAVKRLEDGNILAKTDAKQITYDTYGNILKTQYLPQGQGANLVLNDDNSSARILRLYTEGADGQNFTKDIVAEGEVLYIIALSNKAANGKKVDLTLPPGIACQYRVMDESVVMKNGVIKDIVLNGDSYNPNDSSRVLNNKTRVGFVGTGLKECPSSK